MPQASSQWLNAFIANAKANCTIVSLWKSSAKVSAIAQDKKRKRMSEEHEHSHEPSPTDWKHDGVRVVPGDQLDGNVPSTPGMDRKAAINFARVGAQKLWAGTVHIHPNAKTGAHHHGPLESVIYVVKGRARMRWGNALEFTAEAGPGDFIYVPPYVPHQEINASADEVLECVLCRSDGQAVAVNMDIEAIEKPETVLWIDPTHPSGGV
jgi:uncharacterized RmlC-like cupin family protein